VEVRREVVLPAAPEEVWEELTDPERLEEWFANDVELDLDDGDGVFRWDDGEVRVARIVELEEGRRLGFAWDDGETASYVGFTLEEVAEGTRLVVTESAPSPAGEWVWAIELRAAAICVRA
jgi:uncharacterized protein YndB with AHSA1/START domain